MSNEKEVINNVGGWVKTLGTGLERWEEQHDFDVIFRYMMREIENGNTTASKLLTEWKAKKQEFLS